MDTTHVYGVEMPSMDDMEDFIPLDMIIVVKGMASDGSLRYREMSSRGLAPMERLGMALSYADTVRTLLMKGTT